MLSIKDVKENPMDVVLTSEDKVIIEKLGSRLTQYEKTKQISFPFCR
jgi:hypothetical protein